MAGDTIARSLTPYQPFITALISQAWTLRHKPRIVSQSVGEPNLSVELGGFSVPCFPDKCFFSAGAESRGRPSFLVNSPHFS